MKSINGYYSRNTFDLLKKYVFSSYPSQPQEILIESVYAFAINDDVEKRTTSYHILEISKKEGVKLRILENDHSIGFWQKVTSMSIQGLDYDLLILSTKDMAIRIHCSRSMEADKQKIRMSGQPDTA